MIACVIEISMIFQFQSIIFTSIGRDCHSSVSSTHNIHPLKVGNSHCSVNHNNSCQVHQKFSNINFYLLNSIQYLERDPIQISKQFSWEFRPYIFSEELKSSFPETFLLIWKRCNSHILDDFDKSVQWSPLNAVPYLSMIKYLKLISYPRTICCVLFNSNSPRHDSGFLTITTETTLFLSFPSHPMFVTTCLKYFLVFGALPLSFSFQFFSSCRISATPLFTLASLVVSITGILRSMLGADFRSQVRSKASGVMLQSFYLST